MVTMYTVHVEGYFTQGNFTSYSLYMYIVYVQLKRSYNNSVKVLGQKIRCFPSK